MKTINDYINTSINEDYADVKLIDKINDIFRKNQNKLTRIIQARQDHWDANRLPWSREPMFLIAGPKDEFNIGKDRDYSWVRWKYMKGKKSEVNGTFKNYNIADEDNCKPNSVIGIYYDRHFELITSMNVFENIYDLLEKEYEKYYNNLYESKNGEEE